MYQDHEHGSDRCGGCWTRQTETCVSCGGVLHNQFGDYTDKLEGAFYLEYGCEGCDEPLSADD